MGHLTIFFDTADVVYLLNAIPVKLLKFVLRNLLQIGIIMEFVQMSKHLGHIIPIAKIFMIFNPKFITF